MCELLALSLTYQLRSTLLFLIMKLAIHERSAYSCKRAFYVFQSHQRLALVDFRQPSHWYQGQTHA